MKQLNCLGRKGFLYLSLGLVIVNSLWLSACGGEQPVTTATLPPVQPSSTSVPSTATPTPTLIPTATIAPMQTSEWGSVKSTGAEVKVSPDNRSATIAKLEGFTVLAWQRKLPDESWFERAGGGWVQRRDVVIYSTEAEAKRGVPPPSVLPTMVPTYNSSPVRVNNPAYTFAPISGPDAAFKVVINSPTPTSTTKPNSGNTSGTGVAGSKSPEVKPTATNTPVTPPPPLVSPVPTPRPGDPTQTPFNRNT